MIFNLVGTIATSLLAKSGISFLGDHTRGVYERALVGRRLEHLVDTGWLSCLTQEEAKKLASVEKGYPILDRVGIRSRGVSCQVCKKPLTLMYVGEERILSEAYPAIVCRAQEAWQDVPDGCEACNQ